MGQNFYKSTDEDLMALYKQEYLTAVESDVPIEEKNSHTEFSENFEYLTKRNFWEENNPISSNLITCLSRFMYVSYGVNCFVFMDWFTLTKRFNRYSFFRYSQNFSERF